MEIRDEVRTFFDFFCLLNYVVHHVFRICFISDFSFVAFSISELHQKMPLSRVSQLPEILTSHESVLY